MSANTVKGHLAAGLAYAIFGINIVTTKDVANSGIFAPIALFTLRAIGASALFWLISLFMPKEKVAPGDFVKIILASILGLFIPQMTFLAAITMSTSIDTAIMSSIAPIMTMFVAAIVVKEPITLKKAGGVATSFIGVIILILNSMHYSGGAVETTTPLGFVLLALNALSFASYLGIFRPLISRYSVVTFMKWMFLSVLIISLPFSVKPLLHTDYAAASGLIWGEIGFLILFATFVAYFLIPIGQKNLRPTIVSLYTYLQPIIATLISIAVGMDTISWQKCIAIAMVFAGVAIVNKSRAAGQLPAEKKS